MTPKKKIYFHKINGMLKGKRLEILVDSKIVERPLIQPNMEEPPTYARIIDSNLFDKNTAYGLNDSENYRDIIQRIKKTAKAEYSQKGIFGFFLRPKVEVRFQEP